MKPILTTAIIALLAGLGFACGTTSNNTKCDHEHIRFDERMGHLGNKF